MTEDVLHGLVSYSSLGKMLRVPAPVSGAILTIASVLLKTDFWAIGRTVEKLGINPKWSVDELNKFLEIRYYLIFRFLLKEKLHYLVAPFLFLYFFTLQPSIIFLPSSSAIFLSYIIFTLVKLGVILLVIYLQHLYFS